MSLATLLEYAATRPGVVVSIRVGRAGHNVEALCVSGWAEGPKPAMKVACPFANGYADAVDRAAGQALDYWLTVARSSVRPAWTPSGDAAARAELVLMPVQTMRDEFTHLSASL